MDPRGRQAERLAGDESDYARSPTMNTEATSTLPATMKTGVNQRLHRKSSIKRFMLSIIRSPSAVLNALWTHLHAAVVLTVDADLALHCDEHAHIDPSPSQSGCSRHVHRGRDDHQRHHADRAILATILAWAQAGP